MDETRLMVGQLNTEHVGDVQKNLVLRIVDGGGSNVRLDAIELLPSA